MSKWNWKERADERAKQGSLLGHYIECASSRCKMLFNAKKLETGEAKKLGFLRFCCEKCKRDYQDMLSRQTREQD